MYGSSGNTDVALKEKESALEKGVAHMTKKDADMKKKIDDLNDDEDDKDTKGEEEVPFKDLSGGQKCWSITVVLIKIISIFALLYLFICSLGLLESAFQMLGGKAAGEVFNSGILSNPFAGLMIGVLATVLVQSSSTSTSIIITMVGSKFMSVENAVPIVMGANIGTSVTNTLVSLAQASNRHEFRRAFAGATVHDMFNWMSVIVLLPIEIACGYLTWLSGLMVKNIKGNNDKAPDMLKAITHPLIEHIIQINKNVIADVAQNSNKSVGTVMKRWCETGEKDLMVDHKSVIHVNCSGIGPSSLLAHICYDIGKDRLQDESNISMTVEYETTHPGGGTAVVERCDHLFALTDWSDAAAGAVLLVVSLILLLFALFLIVKVLNSLLSGSVTKVIKKFINSDFPGPFAYFTGYVALFVGTGLTMIIQSSSVFTSTLTPLVGLGVVSVERMYPMTLGANIGTTVTGILAALSQSPDHITAALQIALCHLFFNISGIILFYPLPFTRWPIGLAKILGKTTSKHRWFAIFYLIVMFVLFPGAVFALSYAGWIYLAAVGGPLVLFFFVIAIINALQKKFPRILPEKLKTWDFLPLWCHSLKPVDRLIERVFICKYCQTLAQVSKDPEVQLDIEVEVSEPEPEEQVKQNGDAHIKEGRDQTMTNGKVNHGFDGDTRM